MVSKLQKLKEVKLRYDVFNTRGKIKCCICLLFLAMGSLYSGTFGPYGWTRLFCTGMHVKIFN